MSLGLSYENTSSTADPNSNDFRTSRQRQEIIYSDKSYDFGLPQPSSDVSKPYLNTSASTSLTSSFQSLSGVYSTDVQGGSSMYFPSSSGPAEELMPVSSDASSSISNRTASTLGLSVNPAYTVPSYTTPSTSLSFPLSTLDLFASTDYAPGPLTMAANVLSSSSSPSSNELTPFALDMLIDADLKTPPITTTIQSLSGPFSMSTSLSMHHSQSYASMMDNQATSTNIFESGVPVVTTASSSSSSSIAQSDVWRPY